MPSLRGCWERRRDKMNYTEKGFKYLNKIWNFWKMFLLILGLVIGISALVIVSLLNDIDKSKYCLDNVSQQCDIIFGKDNYVIGVENYIRFPFITYNDNGIFCQPKTNRCTCEQKYGSGSCLAFFDIPQVDREEINHSCLDTYWIKSC